MDDVPDGRSQRPDVADDAAFLSFVSHELRAPLTVAVGTLTMLESGRFGALPEPQQRAIAMAGRAVAQLHAFADDMSTAARIVRGEWPLTATAVTFHDIIADVDHRLHQSNTAVDADIPSDASSMTVVVDRGAIARAVGALAQLAARQAGAETVALRVARHHDAAWLVISAGVAADAVTPPGTVPVDPATSGMGFALFVATALLALHGLRAVRLDAPPDGAAFGVAFPA